jgi:hypothetical protein
MKNIIDVNDIPEMPFDQEGFEELVSEKADLSQTEFSEEELFGLDNALAKLETIVHSWKMDELILVKLERIEITEKNKFRLLVGSVSYKIDGIWMGRKEKISIFGSLETQLSKYLASIENCEGASFAIRYKGKVASRKFIGKTAHSVIVFPVSIPENLKPKAKK